MSSSRPTPPDAADLPKRRSVILRDLLFFQIKLWMDGLKDLVLSPLSIAGAAIDILFGVTGESSWFYRVMRLGERFDLWLNLYGPAQNAASDPDGLLNRQGLRGGDMIRHVDAIRAPAVSSPVPGSSTPETSTPGSPRQALSDGGAAGGDTDIDASSAHPASSS